MIADDVARGAARLPAGSRACRAPAQCVAIRSQRGRARRLEVEPVAHVVVRVPLDRRVSLRASATRRTFPGMPITIEPGGTTMPSGTSVPAATIEPVPIRQPFSRIAPMPIRHAILDRAAVDDGAVAHRHVVADDGRMGLAHDVDQRQVLEVGPRADADGVDVARGPRRSSRRCSRRRGARRR